MKRNEYVWGEYISTWGIGQASTLDTSVKHPRKRKHPIGFVPIEKVSKHVQKPSS